MKYKLLRIPKEIKRKIIWVKYGVIMEGKVNGDYDILGFAEVQARFEKN